jgi:type I restriction enzyme S subunit
MSLTKYDSYKDSGVDWLGDIPEHWGIRRIKDIAKTQSGTTPSSKNKLYYDGTHNWIRTTDLNNGLLYNSEYLITDLALEECSISFIPKDSILIAMYGGFGTIGKNALLKKESTINQSVCAVIPFNNKLDSLYFLYFLKYFRYNWKLFADGTRKDPNINQEAIKRLFLFYPPFQEQQQIAKYLDQQTKTIDKKINLLKAKAEHYQALKKSLINETVCRGLDKTVALKDSGIEWVGAIPEHWTETQFKRILFLLTDYDSNGSFSTIKENVNRVEKDKFAWFVRATDLTNYHKKVPTNDFIWVDKNSYNFLKKSKLYGGELLIAKRGEIGKTYLMPSVNFPATLGPNTYLARLIREEIIPLFAFYFFKTSGGINQLKLRNKSTTIGALYKDDFKSIQIFLPPIKEQQLIINYLDEKTGIIDQIITNIQSQVEQLKGLRKSLINDVVTGKVRVPEMECVK